MCLVVGLGVGLAYLLALLRSPVEVSYQACSLSYYLDAPANLLVPYLVAVVLPFLVCSQRSLVLFGLALLASCAAAVYLATQPGFRSLWCFFAAGLSASLYLHFKTAARTTGQPEANAYARPSIN